MKKTLMIALAVLPAVARAQAATAASDTVKIGKYELELMMDDGTLTGELNVKRAPDGYAATIRAGGMQPVVRSFKRDGAKYVLSAGDESHPVTYTFRFVRDSVFGDFVVGGGGGGMKGAVAGLFKP